MPHLPQPPSSPFEPPSSLYQILSSPLKFLIRHIHALLLLLRGPSYRPPRTNRIRIVCLSDTHTRTPHTVPPGDILIHAGDLSNAGTVAQIQAQLDWLNTLPHKEKVVIAGNHDSYFDPSSRGTVSDPDKSLEWGKIHYLQHNSITLAFPGHGNRRLNIYGAPQIPECGGEEFAFQYKHEEDMWSGTVPRETDVLITHTPPRHHLDLPAGMGCEFLLEECWRVRPAVHVFGHVHAGYGRENIFWDDEQRVYEKLCARQDGGIISDLFAVGAWIGAVKVILYGVQGLLWSRVWGGDEGGCIMVNASLAYRSTGKLENPVQVVDI